MIAFASLRVRLTAWYFITVALLLTVFGTGAWFAMRASIQEAVDHNLRVRIADVRNFLTEESRLGPDHLTEELSEQSLLGLGGSFLEVSGPAGGLLYRSRRLSPHALGALEPLVSSSRTAYSTVSGGNSPLRVASRMVEVNGALYTVRVAEPLHEFQESMDRFGAILLIAAPALLLLASLAGFWMSSRALAPVDRIARDARLITISNLSQRLQVPRAKDELARLALTLNEMLERIETSVRRIVQFTADASHELRTPLTLIHVAAEFSLRRERTREELVDAMGKIYREAGRTSRLVDELLSLARDDSGTATLQLAPVDLAVAARNAAEQVTTLADPKHIQIRADIPASPVMVEGDDAALARVLLIVLDNAVKYTDNGGTIEIELRAFDSQAETIVKDTGAGIAAEDLPHIYDRFWRADKVRSRNMGGLGLGLSIARSIVERHGGTIQAESVVGRGSQFTIRFPLNSPPQAGG